MCLGSKSPQKHHKKQQKHLQPVPVSTIPSLRVDLDGAVCTTFPTLGKWAAINGIGETLYRITVLPG
nr:hypothetical protein Iba_scaffold32250CG0010 [Ipomoea batatas]